VLTMPRMEGEASWTVEEPIFRKPKDLTVALITGFWWIVLLTRVICIFAILSPTYP